MYRSFEAGEAAQLPNAKSIASGLSPPYAGEYLTDSTWYISDVSDGVKE